MNNLLKIIVFTSLPLSAFTQDKIYQKDNLVIEGKVLEINPETIKYKKSTNLNGPDYVINVSEIIKIQFENGIEEVFDLPKTVNNTGKRVFDIENEEMVDDVIKIATNAGRTLMKKCAGSFENEQIEVIFDGVYTDKSNYELNIPIKVSWVPAGSIIDKRKFINGLIKISESGNKSWTLQNSSGGFISGCGSSLNF